MPKIFNSGCRLSRKPAAVAKKIHFSIVLPDSLSLSLSLSLFSSSFYFCRNKSPNGFKSIFRWGTLFVATLFVAMRRKLFRQFVIDLGKWAKSWDSFLRGNNLYSLVSGRSYHRDKFQRIRYMGRARTRYDRQTNILFQVLLQHKTCEYAISSSALFLLHTICVLLLRETLRGSLLPQIHALCVKRKMERANNSLFIEYYLFCFFFFHFSSLVCEIHRTTFHRRELNSKTYSASNNLHWYVE